MVGAGWTHWNLIKSELIKCWLLLKDIKAGDQMATYWA